jgi:hypothetical protein
MFHAHIITAFPTRCAARVNVGQLKKKHIPTREVYCKALARSKGSAAKAAKIAKAARPASAYRRKEAQQLAVVVGCWILSITFAVIQFTGYGCCHTTTARHVRLA